MVNTHGLMQVAIEITELRQRIAELEKQRDGLLNGLEAIIRNYCNPDITESIVKDVTEYANKLHGGGV